MINLFRDLIVKLGRILGLFSKEKPSPILFYDIKQPFSKAALLPFIFPGVIDWSIIPSFARLALKGECWYGIWKINHDYSRNTLFVLLLNKAKLKEELGKIKIQKSYFSDSIEEAISNKLASQASILGSHILLLFWMSKIPKKTTYKPNGEVVKEHQITIFNSWVLNLQPSEDFYVNDDRWAALIIRDLIVELISSHNIWDAYMDTLWEDQISKQDFLSLIKGHVIKYLGSSHRLQPRKSDIKYLKGHLPPHKKVQPPRKLYSPKKTV